MIGGARGNVDELPRIGTLWAPVDLSQNTVVEVTTIKDGFVFLRTIAYRDGSPCDDRSYRSRSACRVELFHRHYDRITS